MSTNKLYEAIVLSGGGLKGFGLLGGLQYMVDSKRFVDDVLFYSGTSIGAVICYFLAIGYTPIEMTVYSITNKIFDTYERKSIDSVLMALKSAVAS
jgi:predicted acylesterase/phospholipase RssA